MEASDSTEIVQYTEVVETPANVVAKLGQWPTPSEDQAGQDGAIDPAVIIAIGKEVWKVIHDNQAVVDIKYDYASALPAGINSTAQLHGFSDLTHKSFRIYGKNAFGNTLYDLTLTLVHQYGGRYNDTGHYLTTVGIIPSSVKVAWGFKVNVDVKQISTTNVGTLADPVASMGLEMSFKAKSPLNHLAATTLYQFRGDSADVLSSKSSH